MKDGFFSPDCFMSGLYNELYGNPYKNVTSAADALKTGENIKTRAREVFNLGAVPKDGEYLKARKIGSSIAYPDYTLQKYSVQLCKNLSQAVFMLEPKKRNKNTPRVAALCGHGYGVRQIVNVTKGGKKRIFRYADNYQKSFAAELAKRGCIVAAPELFGFGEARLKKDLFKPFYASSCETLSLHLLPFGLTTASMRIFQAISCLDLLEHYGSADAGKLYMMGISGGGLTALYASLLDERVKKTVVSGYINTFRDSILSLWHCPDNYIPGLLGVGEIYDFACALAPRELLIESGTRDRLFPIEASRLAHEKIRKIYSLCGAGDKLHIDVFDGKHSVNGRMSFDFLSK